MRRILLFVAVGLFAAQAHAQGGETCASATTISSLPYVDVGSTVTAVDDYFASCPDGSQEGGRDRVYKYTTGPSVEYVDISLCQAVTNFDSKLMVYEGACTGATYACRDDGCQSPAFPNPYNSTLTNLPLNPGTTYYIVVDGYNSGSSGNYRLNVNVGAGPPDPDIFSDDFEPGEPLALGKRHDPAACAPASHPGSGRGAVSGLIERLPDRDGEERALPEPAYLCPDGERLR